MALRLNEGLGLADGKVTAHLNLRGLALREEKAGSMALGFNDSWCTGRTSSDFSLATPARGQAYALRTLDASDLG